MGSNKQIMIGYDAATGSLTATPSPCYAPQGSGATTIVWSPVPNSGVELTSTVISTQDGNPYTGTQPTMAGQGTCSWVDPETSTDYYEYIVAATVGGSNKTLDPQIINTSGLGE